MAERHIYVGVFIVFITLVVLSPMSNGALNETCSSNDNCTDVNGTCTDGTCQCQASQYELEGSCAEKIALDSECPSSVSNTAEPCSDDQAICQNVGIVGAPEYQCTCNTGYNGSIGTCVIIDCNLAVINVTNGNASFNSSIYGANATVNCDEGYKSPSPELVTCQANGTWSQASCSVIECSSTINTVANGMASVGTRTYGSNATVTCNEGYENSSLEVVTCQVDGTWSKAFCLIKDCGQIPSNAVTLGNAALAVSGSTNYLSTATVTCSTGYKTSTPQISCQSDGQWSSAVCTKKDCGQIPSNAVTLGNAVLTVSGSTNYLSTAIVTCSTGYETSTQQISCQSDGQWSPAVCTKKDCGQIPSNAVTFGNAALTVSGSTNYLATATVTCSTGYETSTQQISCQSDGQWSPAVCTKKDCGQIPSNAVTFGNAALTVSGSTNYLATATVTCSTGYETSTPQISCQSDGQWSSAVCTKIELSTLLPKNVNSVTIMETEWTDCGRLSDLKNGTVSSIGTTYEATATYTCNTGYIISGTTSNTTTIITCLSSGAWSVANPNPYCIVKRDPLGAACPEPSTTNVSPGNLCSGDSAECLSNGQDEEYTCQCITGFYDDNAEVEAGSCRNVEELRVQSISLTPVTTTEMTVTWTPDANKNKFISGYVVEWKQKSNSTSSGITATLTSTNHVINSGNLISGRTYTVKVITQNTVSYTMAVKTTSKEKEQALKPQIPGSIVTDDSDLDASNNDIYIVWNAANGYVARYEVKLIEDGEHFLSSTSTKHSVIINNNDIKNGHRYNVSVTAVSEQFDGNKVEKSDTYMEEIKTVVTAPTSPPSVICHLTTDTSITIRWGTPSTPNGDLLEYKIETYLYEGDSLLQTNRTGDLNLEYEITGLNPGSYYYFKVYTVNEEYVSTVSTRLNESYCGTRANVADAPNHLNVSNIQSRSFVVSWIKPTKTFGENLGYVVQVRTRDDVCVMELIRRCSNCTGTINDTALENMCPASTEENVLKASIDNVDIQNYTVADLNPDISYTVSVTAVNAAGRGKPASVTIQTDEEIPKKPKDVTISNVTQNSCTVNWNIDGPRPGYTTYVVVITPVSPATFKDVKFTGFSTRSKAITSLEEFWNYTVTIRANTSKGFMESDPINFQTLSAAPGAVDGFEVIPATQGGDYTKLKVQWKIPVLLERNSEITGFVLLHNTSLDENSNYTVETNADTAYVYQVVLDVIPEVTYEFKVYAMNAENETGTESQKNFIAPAGVPRNDFEVVDKKAVIQDSVILSQTTVQVIIDPEFFNRSREGTIVMSGLIICAREKCPENGNAIGNSITLEEFGQYHNYDKASKNGYTQYRATGDKWLQIQQSRGNRKRRAIENVQAFTIGNEICNETTVNQFCNGPLQPQSSFIVHAVVCTNGGCLISNEYGPYVTLAEVPAEKDANIIVIVVAVVVSVVVIAIVVVVAIIIVRRRTAPSRQMKKLEDHDNPPLDDINTTHIKKSRPIMLRDFEDYLTRMHKDSNLLFSAEYDDLRSIAPNSPQEAANREENRLKNRYINILPFDHSRVKLFSNGEEDNSDYINANYLPGYRSPREYIGCQGPIPGTIDDYWRMVWEQNVSIVVMLTLCKEGQKVKCEQYWPEETSEPKQYGEVVVEVTSTSTIQTYVMRIFKITNAGKTRTVKHFHFLSWLDFQANVKHDIILDFITHVRSHVQPPDTVGPMIVHCSAGVGRTGTYVCLDHLMQFIEEHDFDVSVDIFNMVLKLRANRPLMVQTEQQYVFIHDCVKELMERKRAKSMENIYENQGFASDDNIYQNTEPSLYENVQMKTEL